ncbi:hypothetical protein MVES_002434 [Malassezia vespertilionis]|uniref:Telomerase reverse transcriptase n=1 Tax=Malassezia vespertilionis TaxID=2020962 RepID=A0A2N1JA77_9BASI|nr:hypothetical protein MVES_002434 [Malassezia vespertilionis]
MADTVVRAILPQYFPSVLTLAEYLAHVLPASELGSVLAPPQGCEEEWARLLGGAMGVHALTHAPPHMPQWMAQMEEENDTKRFVALIQHVQRVILAECSAGQRRSDMLVLGYRRDTQDTRGISMLSGISNTHPNTVLASMITSSAWQRLLRRAGPHMFYHMLLTTSYFYPLRDTHDCFVQLWGEPLTEQPLPQSLGKRAAPQKAPRQKKRKIESGDGLDTMLYFRRNRLFYARAVHVYRYGIVLGLPPDHVLQKKSFSIRARVARLARSMFPIQFGLPPQWQSTRAKGAGRTRWPMRLKAVVPMLRTMLRKHDQFHYAAALEGCCPSKLFAKNAPAPAHAQGPPFYACATSHGRVCWYVRTALHAILPTALLGSERNRSVLVALATRLVCARRGERLHMHDALQHFRTNDCAWLGKETRVPPCEQAKRKELVREMVYWIVEQFVLPLLRTTFYATEAAAFKQRVLYFRQDLWTRISAPLVERLRETLFERVPRLGRGEIVNPIRMLPKEYTLRPIVNLKRRTNEGTPVNVRLQNAFDIMAYEASRRPEMYGNAVHGANDIYVRLRKYKASLLHTHGHIPPLYIVRADISAAFDSLDHASLLRLVRAMLSQQQEYVVQRYAQLKLGIGRVTRSSVRRATLDAEYPTFLSTKPNARHAVLVDHVAYALVDATQVLQQIESHITRSLVRFNGTVYRQRRGIPQGSILSTALCNMLLADVERRYMKDVEGCLMRYTDDFLLLTTSRASALHFCTALHEGFPKHGCFIAREKTLVNFDVVCGGARFARIGTDAPVPWCGYEIHPRTLAVTADRARYPHHLADTITVHTGTRPGEALVYRLLHAMRARIHILYMDTDLNTVQGMHANVLEGFALAAAKLHAYCRAMRPRIVLPRLLLRAIRHAVRMTYPMMTARAKLATTLHKETTCTLHRASIEWLGFFAFGAFFGARQGYEPLAAALRGVAEAPRYLDARA